VKKYKAVLFDFDGVLGMTMEDNYHAWNRAFAEYGIDFDKNEYFLLEGLNTKKVAEHFSRNSRVSPEIINNIVILKEKYYVENNNFSLYEGVETTISRLKKGGYLLGLVSGASYVRISATLQKVFLGNFDVVLTGDKVNNCKPHHEPYLNAAKALSMKPSDCVVVENAPLGIESARAAGMYCIAVASTLEKKYLFKADIIINKLLELEGIL